MEVFSPGDDLLRNRERSNISRKLLINYKYWNIYAIFYRVDDWKSDNYSNEADSAVLLSNF